MDSSSSSKCCFKVAQASRISGYPLLPNRDSYFRTHVQPRGSLSEHCSTSRGDLLSAQRYPKSSVCPLKCT